EEGHAVVERRWQAREISPDVEGAVRSAIGTDAETVQPRKHPVALLAEDGLRGPRLLLHVLNAEERDGGPLQRLGTPAVEERAGARDGLDHRARPDRPGHAPARVAPVLGEPVEDDDRIAIDVLDVPGGALDGQFPRAHRPHVVRVELVDEESALELSRRPHPAPQLVALDELARRIAGIGEEQGGKTATL